MYDLDKIKQLSLQLVNNPWHAGSKSQQFDDYFQLCKEYHAATSPKEMLALVQEVERLQEKCKQAKIIFTN